jgi:hypothetical protein
LFGVGLPLVLIVVSLLLVVYRPNSTEQKLLGRWEIVSPAARRGVVLNYRPYELLADSTPWIWVADDDVIVTGRFEQPVFWARLKLKLGLSTPVEELQILRLDENEMELRYRTGTVPIVYKRIGTHSP